MAGGWGRYGVSELDCRVSLARARAKIQEVATSIPYEPPATDSSYATLTTLGADVGTNVLTTIKEKELIGIRDGGNLRCKPEGNPRVPIHRWRTRTKNRIGGVT